MVKVIRSDNAKTRMCYIVNIGVDIILKLQGRRLSYRTLGPYIVLFTYLLTYLLTVA